MGASIDDILKDPYRMVAFSDLEVMAALHDGEKWSWPREIALVAGSSRPAACEFRYVFGCFLLCCVGSDRVGVQPILPCTNNSYG